MDESWRMSMGGGFLHHNSPRQRSRKLEKGSDDDDFHDVFGGPPRTVVNRRSAAGFYDEVFSPPSSASTSLAEKVRTGGRRNLPSFNIPAPKYNTTISSCSSSSCGTSSSNRRLLGVRTVDGFYDDIFGSFDFLQSTTKSKSNNDKSRSNSSSDHDYNSSSIRSRKIINHDASLSSFTSKLRPITIPTRRHEHSQASTLSGWDSNLSSPAVTDMYCPNCSKRATSVDNFSLSSNYITGTERELEKKVVVEVKQELRGGAEGASAVDEAIAWARERYCSTKQAADVGSDRDMVDYSEEDYLSVGVQLHSDSTFSFGCDRGDD